MWVHEIEAGAEYECEQPRFVPKQPETDGEVEEEAEFVHHKQVQYVLVNYWSDINIIIKSYIEIKNII